MGSKVTRKLPMYEQIRQALSQEIAQSPLQPGELFITLDTICERFNTSKITAQRVLMELVKDGLLYTKRGHGAFIAQPNRSQASMRLAFLFGSNIEVGSVHLVISGAEDVARAHHYNLILCNTNNELAQAHAAVERLLAQRIDGALLDMPSEETDMGSFYEIYKRLEDHGIPVVLTEKRFMNASGPFSCVVTDNFGGSIKVIEHLCESGHRVIGGLLEDWNSGALERLEGFRGALLKCGAFFSPQLVKLVQGLESVPRLIDELLAMPKPPTALFCAHDVVAREAMQHLQGRGLHIPADISVIGFDDLPFSKYLNPPLTTMRQPLEEVGRRAMEILIQRMQKDFKYYPQIRLETELVVRESSRQLHQE